MERVVVHDVDSALALLTELNAPPRLIRHHELVAEAARELVTGLEAFSAHFNTAEVLVGAALHDAGKVLHPDEMSHPGNRHEEDGRRLLLARGVGEVARFCVTHAAWDAQGIPLDDLLVALADKLWKGKRLDELERKVVEELATSSGQEFWTVFSVADDVFEAVAAKGDQRLARSIP